MSVVCELPVTLIKVTLQFLYDTRIFIYYVDFIMCNYIIIIIYDQNIQCSMLNMGFSDKNILKRTLFFVDFEKKKKILQ